MNDDLTLLASTYLDGEATPDERARIEADPSLLAEVERLRAARATLLDTRWFERPGDDVREAAIAAALTAWDVSSSGLTGSAAGLPPAGRRSHVTSFERRRSYTRVLGVAAAVVAVAGLGVVLAQFDGGDDSDESVAIDAAADTQTRSDGDAEVAEQIQAPSDTTNALLSGEVAPDGTGGADQDSSAATEAAPSADLATEATEAPAATATAAAPASQANLTTLDELGAFAAEASAAVDDDVNRDALTAPCPGESFDDIVEYVAIVTFRDRQVMVGIDTDRERAIAVDPGTCEIVAQAPLP